VVLGGSGEIGFIFRSCIRGLMPCSVLLLIEMLTIQERRWISSAQNCLPQNSHSSLPLDGEGALMHGSTHPAQDLELVDGVKILNHQDDSWILILPDAGEPLVHLFANSNDREWVDQTLREYRTRVQTFVEHEQGKHLTLSNQSSKI